MIKLHSWFLVISLFGALSFLVSFYFHHRLDAQLELAGREDPNSEALNSLSAAVHSSNSRISRPRASSTDSSPIPPYHVVFSTSCEDQQNWESYVLFYHAWKVGQRGTVTRIASGCSPEQAEALSQFHSDKISTMSTSFLLHLTPDFSRSKEYIKIGSARYKYMNKPYGLLHWMDSTFRLNTTETFESPDLDGIIILMDPDQILLRPIVHDYTNQEVTFAHENPSSKVVKHGFPISQQDGYLTNQWMGLNVSFITNGGNIEHISSRDGPLVWNSGPPYLATVKDMYEITILWTDYAPRVYAIHPKLFAEMFGYIFATTQIQNLHPTLIRSLVVSNTETPAREGWPYVDDTPDAQICSVLESTPTPFASSIDLSSKTRLPIIMHYCKRYLLDHWFFSKYRLKKKYISCETPILQLPPTDLAQRNISYSFQPPPNGYYKDTPTHQHIRTWNAPFSNITSTRQAKREAFMVCQLIRAVNEAAMYFKRSSCSDVPHTNWNTNYTFFNDPNNY